MKYICLGYLEPGQFEKVSESDRNTMLDECFGYNDELRRNGRLVAEEPLQPANTAVTVSWTNGKVAVTDGPYAETKEHLGAMLITTLIALQRAKTGVDTRHVLAINVPVMSHGKTPRQVLDFYKDSIRRVDALPGVTKTRGQIGGVTRNHSGIRKNSVDSTPAASTISRPPDDVRVLPMMRNGSLRARDPAPFSFREVSLASESPERGAKPAQPAE